jgi:hypothetical protein
MFKKVMYSINNYPITQNFDFIKYLNQKLIFLKV